jgi:hypothetical protein
VSDHNNVLVLYGALSATKFDEKSTCSWILERVVIAVRSAFVRT